MILIFIYQKNIQNLIRSCIYDATCSIFTLSCCIVSLSLIVTYPSSYESKSYVIQKGVPISSCLLYLFPIEPDSSYSTTKSFDKFL